MADRNKATNELDPEQLQKRKFRMKCKFRALVRLTMANAYWLIDAAEYYEGVDNVKLRVEQAVRKAKKKQLLSINDKTLLSKPAAERTDREKKYLYRIIGGLKCFKRYPNTVKRKLAAVTYFKYYGPGRTIVREHQEAHALYFIVTGDVMVSQFVWDDLLKQHDLVEVATLHPGDMFGEVSLLHNIKRTATVTTTGHCELLTLMKEDFKHVLQASVQKEWDQVRRIMSAFSYFEPLDEVARREGCIVAKIKSYVPNETVLGDGVGVPNFVYFLLSGKCQMIESMQVIVTTHLGRSFYTLYDPHPVSKEESETDSETDFETKYFANYRKTWHRGSFVSETGSVTLHARIKSPEEQEKSEAEFSDPSDAVPLQSKDLLRPTTSQFGSMKFSLPMLTKQQQPKNIRTYFMQVCQFNPGSTFGFGENMRDRRIVALTPVSCMLLPKVWLLQRNSANIWTRIKHYLDKTILNKKQLFEEFVAARRWAEYRGQLVEDVLARSKTVNSTSIHDVPYSIRAGEMTDL